MNEQTNLFGQENRTRQNPRDPSDSQYSPLAHQYRPKNLQNFIGITGIYEKYPFLRSDKLSSLILWGSPGCGKTTLSRSILSELDEDVYDTALLLNTRLSETQLVKAILNELGIESKARSKSDLIDALYQSLLQRIQAGRQIIVIIDEAQNLPFEVLEQVRLLSNLEADDQKLMQIVLIGQPELDEKLQERRLRQLRQRILVYYKLRSLTRQETMRYIEHRLTLAGASGESLLARDFGPRLAHAPQSSTGRGEKPQG